ncbi:MAG: hypothetical protein EKK64_10125 [Neisseriaceae bacterium]|jgi:hypothetical protein|nr:MAG: hypothetical protein EKK64_10125 [Neisseriaceae bacterium]
MLKSCKLLTMSKLSIFSSLLLTLLLSSCGGSGGSNVTPDNSSSTQSVSIDEMTVVPVINGSATKGTLYIHK